MSNAEKPVDRIPTERLQPDRVIKTIAARDPSVTPSYAIPRPDLAAVDLPNRSRHAPAPPLSARAAAAQFDLAAILETPREGPRERALVAPGHRARTDLATRTTATDGSQKMNSKTSDTSRDAGRLPSAWYKQADEIAEATRQERKALLIRGSAAACLVTGGALLFWLGAAGSRNKPEPVEMATTFAPTGRPPLSVLAQPETPPAALLAPNTRGLVTTAQILAVAERFVATGDILAARAMLSDKASEGDARALFALAETYDANLLASWNAQNIEASPAYARMLYTAALRAGMVDAQMRLDALR